jgi:hypothetical protein
MARAAVAGVAAFSMALAGCAGQRNAIRRSELPPACPLLTQLARTGSTVAHANVSDPDEFEATLPAAVATYLRTAHRLQAAVPARLHADVERMILAVRSDHFSQAEHAPSDIDEYAHSTCRST